MTLAALQAGKHVLCEKPPALNRTSAFRMHQAALQNNRLLMYGFVRRFGRVESLAKKYVEQGRIGDIHCLKAGIVKRCGCPGGWFTEKEKSGGGALIDLGVHLIDLAGYFLSDVRPVSVIGGTFKSLVGRSNIEDLNWYKASDCGRTINDVEDSAVALILYESGAILLLEAGWIINTGEEQQYLSINGSKGGMKLSPRLEIFSEENDHLININPVFDSYAFDIEAAFAAETAHFADCVIDGVRCICPSEEGIKVMSIIDAIYESSRSGEAVKIN